MLEPSRQRALERALDALIADEEEFRALDAAAGDGDLGVNVRSAAKACAEWLGEQDAPIAAKDLVEGFAEVCGSTSPSTFGSLVSRGLKSAAAALEDADSDLVGSLVIALEAGIATVRRRGGAEPGEKTFLDALLPALEAARTQTSLDDALDAMRSAAISGTMAMVDQVPRHGRAAWVGERARGIPDAGSVVVIRFLEALGPPGRGRWEPAPR